MICIDYIKKYWIEQVEYKQKNKPI